VVVLALPSGSGPKPATHRRTVVREAKRASWANGFDCGASFLPAITRQGAKIRFGRSVSRNPTVSRGRFAFTTDHTRGPRSRRRGTRPPVTYCTRTTAGAPDVPRVKRRIALYKEVAEDDGKEEPGMHAWNARLERWARENRFKSLFVPLVAVWYGIPLVLTLLLMLAAIVLYAVGVDFTKAGGE
jgi:hypothetical protein